MGTHKPCQIWRFNVSPDLRQPELLGTRYLHSLVHEHVLRKRVDYKMADLSNLRIIDYRSYTVVFVS